jgi:hypothetical protein
VRLADLVGAVDAARPGGRLLHAGVDGEGKAA